MSYTYDLKMAELSFHVTSQYQYSQKYCAKYIVDEPGEIAFTLTAEDIARERERLQEDTPGTDPGMKNSPDYYLESICLLRKIADIATLHNVMLMHGSSICVDGKAYIFTALSGTGKSTHTGLLRKLLGERAVMINDDKPFLRFTDSGVQVYGSPWMGKHYLGDNISAPLAGIFFLYQAPDNTLTTLAPEKALTLLMSQCHRPEGAQEMISTLDMVDRLLNEVPLYSFGCNMDISAAELSSSVMK